MADEERVDLPDDVDAVLRRTLAVEPSPEFLAGVREHVREGHRSSRWIAPWILVPGAAAVTIAVALGLTLFPGSPVVSPQPPAAPGSRVAAAERPRPDLAAIPRAAAPRARPGAARPGRVSGSGSGSGESPLVPVVIVDQRQRAALGLFVRMVQQGSLPADTLAQTVPVPNQPIEEQVLPIAVEPVAVSPIPVGGVLRSGSERN